MKLIIVYISYRLKYKEPRKQTEIIAKFSQPVMQPAQ